MNESNINFCDYISINVEGDEYQTVEIKLSRSDVTMLYSKNKQLNAEVADLKKKFESQESSTKYYRDMKENLQQEINDLHSLLTALGIPEKNDKAESYASGYNLTTRFALHLAYSKGV